MKTTEQILVDTLAAMKTMNENMNALAELNNGFLNRIKTLENQVEALNKVVYAGKMVTLTV